MKTKLPDILVVFFIYGAVLAAFALMAVAGIDPSELLGTGTASREFVPPPRGI